MVQMLLLHIRCSDQQQLADAACHCYSQQQLVQGLQLVSDLSSCCLGAVEAALVMQGENEARPGPPCSRQGLMGQIWQGCCLVLPCPTDDQRSSDHLRSSQPAIISSTLCHQQDRDTSAAPEPTAEKHRSLFEECKSDSKGAQVAGSPGILAQVRTAHCTTRPANVPGQQMVLCFG